MSAVAPPEERVLIGPKKDISIQDADAPMNNLPAITATMSSAEANAKRNDWVPPSIIPGEFVFYRESRSSKESAAWITGTANKTFRMLVLKDNGGVKEVNSVCFYDHTLPDPMSVSDPRGPFNNHGTFRRSRFFSRMAEFIQNHEKMKSDFLSMAAAVLDLQARMSNKPTITEVPVGNAGVLGNAEKPKKGN